YRARAVILALGLYDLPYPLNLEGGGRPKVMHHHKEPHPCFSPRLVVIGPAHSAADVALATWRKGAAVTMVIRESALRDSVKYWVKPDIDNRISEGSIKAYFNSTVSRITPEDVEIATPSGKVVIPNDFVLAMTGYQPPFAFMERCGIAF